MKERRLDFTTGSILGSLIQFALPVLFALFLQSLYGAVDLLVVGKYATSADVSGVAVGSQLMMSAANLISSFAVGATVLLGQKIGEGHPEEAGKVIGTSVVCFLAAGILLSVLLPFLAPRLAVLMHAPEEAYPATVQYLRICGSGAFMIISYNLIGSIFRGIGDSRTPLMTVAIACAVNIAGDLALVRGFGMGAAGAAIATVGAQTVSVIVSLLLIRRQKLPFSFGRKDLRVNKRHLGGIVKIGFPIALEDLLVGFSFLAITAIVNSLGLIASASIGVAEKVSGFIMLVPLAFMQAMSAYVAQNTGAGKPERSRRGLWYAIGVSTAFGIVMFAVTFFGGSLLAGIFSKDAAVIASAADYLRAYAFDCILTCFLFCFIGYFNGIGRTTFVMAQGVLAAFLIRIPFAYVMSRISGRMFHIGLGIPASTVVQITAFLICYNILKRKENNG